MDEHNQFKESTIDRLARLEERVDLKFMELDKSIVLAANNLEKEKIYTRDQISDHFEVVNNARARIDKLTKTFATRDWVNEKLAPLSKLVYIGVGLVLIFEFVLRFMLKS